MLTDLVAAAVCMDDDTSGATNHSCLVNCWIFVARSPSRPDAGSWFTSLKVILRCIVGSTFLSTLEREGRLRRFLRHCRAQEVLLSARRWTFIPWHNPPRSAKVFRDGLMALNCLSVPSREGGRSFLLWYPQRCCRRSCGPRTVRKPCRRRVGTSSIWICHLEHVLEDSGAVELEKEPVESGVVSCHTSCRTPRPTDRHHEGRTQRIWSHQPKASESTVREMCSPPTV